jgi:cobalamin biosynthesis protein CbiD
MIRRVPALLAAVAMVVALGGCAAGDDDSGEPGDAGPTTSPAATAGSEASSSPVTETEQVVEVSVAVTDGKVEPKPRRIEVAKDSQVRLIVTSDVDDAVHVHGYEIEAELEAGRPTTVEFVADQSGIFEVETHESELELLQLEVR